MRSALVDPRTDASWQRLADTAPGATIFHHPAWIDLVCRTYRYAAAGVVVLEADEPVAGLPVALVDSRLTGRRLVALPFSDQCPPLVLPGAPRDAVGHLAGALERERARLGIPLEVRAPVPEAGTSVERFVTHRLALEAGRDAVERGFRSSARRNVRAARARGVTVERRTDTAALRLFYDLHLRTRRRLGVPTQSWSFVGGLAPLLAAELGWIGVARVGDRPAAAAVFLRHGRTLTYKYGASHEDFLALRPNNAVFADAIAHACELGLGTLDFGRTDLDQEGLRRFKASWGADETPLAYTYAGRKPPAADAHGPGLLAEVIRRAPLPAGRLIGRLAYRHVG